MRSRHQFGGVAVEQRLQLLSGCLNIEKGEWGARLEEGMEVPSGLHAAIVEEKCEFARSCECAQLGSAIIDMRPGHLLLRLCIDQHCFVGSKVAEQRVCNVSGHTRRVIPTGGEG